MQNRVDPFGHIINTKARGMWMGNRGRIHNERKELISPFKLKAWLTCKVNFNGRKRQIMAATQSFSSWMKPLPLLQGTAHVLNAGGKILTVLKSSGSRGIRNINFRKKQVSAT